MEYFHNVHDEDNSFNEYHCMLHSSPKLACLDIAGVSTLHNDTCTASDIPSVTSSGQKIYTRISSDCNHDPFGIRGCSKQTSSGTCNVGDGVVTHMDIWALLAYQFQISPYDALGTDPSSVDTVCARTETSELCDHPQGITRIDYMTSHANDTCSVPEFAPPERRSLSECGACGSPCCQGSDGMLQCSGLFDMNTSIGIDGSCTCTPPQGLSCMAAARTYDQHVHTTTTYFPQQTYAIGDHEDLDAKIYEMSREISGSWYLIRIPGVHLALELTVLGAKNPYPISLNYHPISDHMVPVNAFEYELRYRRVQELLGLSEDDCSVIEATGFVSRAMHQGIITLSQFHDSTTFACAYDLALWIPTEQMQRSISQRELKCEVAISAGSSSIDGNKGRYQARTSCVEPMPLHHTPPPSPPHHHHDHDHDNERQRHPMRWMFPMAVLLFACVACAYSRVNFDPMSYFAPTVAVVQPTVGPVPTSSTTGIEMIGERI